MSAFDAEAFLNQEVNAPLETTYVPIPEAEYEAVVDDGDNAVTAVEYEGTEGPFQKLYINFILAAPEVAEKLGLQKVTCRAQFTLDLEEDGVTLQVGPNKNVKLGQCLNALGLNSEAWSPQLLKGAGPILVRVKQTPDKKDPTSGIIYTDINKFTSL